MATDPHPPDKLVKMFKVRTTSPSLSKLSDNGNLLVRVDDSSTQWPMLSRHKVFFTIFLSAHILRQPALACNLLVVESRLRYMLVHRIDLGFHFPVYTCKLLLESHIPQVSQSSSEPSWKMPCS